MSPNVNPVAVVFDGPYADQDRYGEEVPVWSVSLEDENGNALKVYTVRSYGAGDALAGKIARDRRIEFVREASRG
jgi:hypothetical protein